MKKRWRKAFREELERDAEQIMKEVNSDPNLKDVKAPEGIHTRLMNQIQSERTKEERELIALGRIYKKRRKQNKFVVVAASVLVIMAIGITSLGGPERIIQTMKRMVGDREHTRVDSQDEQIDHALGSVEQEKAYQAIKDEFGVDVVNFYGALSGMHFVDVVIEEETQNARLYYANTEEDKTIVCTILFNYRIESAGIDVEDPIVNEESYIVSEVPIIAKKYEVEGNKISRWRVEFQYKKIQYFIGLTGFSDAEIEKFVKNLYFS